MRRPVSILLLLAAPPLLVLTAFKLTGGFSTKQAEKQAPPPAALDLPTTTVKRGEVRFTVNARGELQGSNSEMLVAPMTGARELIITSLRQPGELVDKGDLVVQFDTTEQEFALAEAEADLAEAEQQVAQAEAEAAAKQEETNASLAQAQADLKLAELEARRNPLVAAIVARQNDLAVVMLRGDHACERTAQGQPVAGNEFLRALHKCEPRVRPNLLVQIDPDLRAEQRLRALER